MTTTTTQTRKTEQSLSLERVLAAPPERVWKALTDPRLLSKWFAPGPMQARIDRFEARPGGSYQVTMHPPEGADHVAGGKIIGLKEGSKLELEWAWKAEDGFGPQSRVTFTLAPEGKGTRLTLVHDRLANAQAVDEHIDGWIGCLDKLPDAL